MASSEFSEDLLILAKQHLGLPAYASAASVPQAYLVELKRHQAFYPHDTNFRLELQPGRGLGVVTCLEQGCENIKIPLAARIGKADGGKADGLGSLTAYRSHVVDHASHMRNRHMRVKAEQMAKKSGSGHSVASVSGMSRTASQTPRRSLLTTLDNTFGPPPSSSPVSSTSRARGLPSSSPIVKREPVRAVIPFKRPSISYDVKSEDEDSDVSLFPLASSSPPSAKKLKFEETKPFGNPRIASSPSKPPRLPDHTPAVDVDDTRAKLIEVQSKIGTVQLTLTRLRRKKKPSRADFTRIANLALSLAQLQREKERYNALIPSAAPKPTKVEAKPLHPQHHGVLAPQMVASGSNSRLPPAFGTSLSSPTIKPLQAPKLLTSGIVKMDLDEYNPLDDSEDENVPPGALIPYFAPAAKADDIEKFLIAAGNAEQFDGNQSVDKALEKLHLQNLFEPLPGMQVALMPHQAIGVAWMLEKEKGRDKGGCLSDEMGLGKTIQMIAVMVSNRSDDPRTKTNLIVAPLALLDQWKLEIEMKTNLDLQILIYHGSSRPRKKADLMKYDVILTTFQTLAHQWPDEEARLKEKTKKRRKKKKDDFITSDSEADEPKPRKGRKTELGILFQIDWHRVILDEVQNIRNKMTRVSRAVTHVNAKYRWCLTGTPIINGLCDAYPYLRFLQIRPWYEWEYFNSHIACYEKKNPSLATNKLQVVFASTLLRRKKDSMLDGKRLVELPEKDVQLCKLEFSEEERAIYKMVEVKSQATFNRYLRAGVVLKNYHQVLVLLLRLRQICSHPSLIYEEGDGYINPDGSDDRSSLEARMVLTRASQLVGGDFVLKMKAKLKESALRRMDAEKASPDATVEDDECPICFDVFTDACVTSCTHVFCRECIMDVVNAAPAVDDANEPVRFKENQHPCPTCRTPISEENVFPLKAFEPSTAELAQAKGGSSKIQDTDEEMADVSELLTKKAGKGKRKKPVPKKRRRAVDSEDDSEEDDDEDEGDDMSDFIVESDEDEEEKDARRALKKRLSKGKGRAIVLDCDEDDDIICGKPKDKPQPTRQQDGQIMLMSKFLPSTKMKFMMESLKKNAKENPEEKTLIISQWTQCLSLVSNYLEEEGILHVKYQGDMNRAKRDQAVRVFMSKDKATVMLMSLKCGGVGLNLTRANRVISLDLGWSEAVESQAFDRVHRLGQMRDVVVQRLVVSDTVEDRVLALQERKRNLADGSLGEGSGKKIGRLSVRELANLFGLDHRGRLLNA
ncbi:hypothetical protein JAAARDRAFT_205244 [Jaapia argillacea MUCL 33604]|uniref:Uncharacterized protein n=1 Tax=Jaapia argillacea MUCL 33604 TaxID=933084 RepID=A0A067PZL2_9AGAM|nr:hypothetical protein JAAARDRAFT_205244 [Jaapia argillacea MUCL 33604]